LRLKSSGIGVQGFGSRAWKFRFRVLGLRVQGL